MVGFDRLPVADVIPKNFAKLPVSDTFFAKLPESRFDNLTVPRKTEKIRQIACDSHKHRWAVGGRGWTTDNYSM